MPRWLMILLLGMGLWTSSAQAQLPAEPINKREFRLPFRVDPSRGRVIELRLYLTRSGSGWELHTTAKPNEGGFQVRLTSDGVYAFATQVVYEDNRTEPLVSDLKPGVRVQIDTQLPSITLKPRPGNPGTAGVAWECRDELLDPKSIRLECRYPGQSEWMLNPGTYTPSGYFFWQLDGKRLEVRVVARDLAGNVGESMMVTIPDGTTTLPPGGGFNPGKPEGSLGSGGREPFYINRRKISLETRIHTGKSGLAETKLWVKPDGQKWTEVQGGIREVPRGTANASEPLPDGTRLEKKLLEFTAETDGKFGFLITSRSRVGLGEKPPRDSDSPKVEVVIDTQAPMVTLKEAKVIPNGERGNYLSIQWEASDPHLAPQPVYIDYASAPDGAPFNPKTADWRTIAEKRDNSGSFMWPVPNADPYRFHVRIQVIDRAGNRGEAITKEPVIVDLFTPKSEILDVIPLEPMNIQPR
ncbi:hypothetical protein [Tuwongella immobilis]|uniref:Ig-like domain-containing protein n=1 Tax=Tuwongella immobilis TaxID=692036 RepID=A0A6C2YKH4_9BACT|nr:hypothetical protein [Tuwongella immobilis]VIP01613.1 Uncharacterized protein OS=Planctomyces limnophilus (strain ATCC 43296 / DSM 3776 / IFAM 1008 / 290) GN=Plim_2060 PE=4 SV=1 [Tuwongella immobilis]VTR98928.1 Uncharacterized protein OS=Planctomyces limnophilus (strain ATCC 43296 / DSM 3776 / IFAM 1008 / 290) GN=Plim_2060 PE=4 SV=1 [Tuwongella immobilis]